MNAPVQRSELTSIRAKAFYGAGSVAYGIKDFGFGTLLLFYYSQVVGLPPIEVSLALFIVLCVDAFADPIIGQISDNLNTRLGRRHPLMYLSAVPVSISYFFLWLPPAGWSHAATLAYLIVVAIAVRTFISMYEVPSSALVPELTDDYDQRTSFVSWRYCFGVAAGIVINYVTYHYLLYPDAAHKAGQLNPAGYPGFALVSALIMISSILISARGTQKYVPLFSKQPQRRLTLRQILGEMFASLSHPQFIVLLTAAIFGTLAIGLGGTLLIYFNTYFWQFTTNQIAYFGLTGLGALILAPIIAAFASRRLGKKNAALIFYFTCVTATVTPIVLRLVGFFPPNGSPFLLALVFSERFISATLGVGCLILFSSMMADVVEDSAVKTGRRSEGLFFASMSFIQKMLSGAGGLIAGLLLQIIHLAPGADPATLDPATIRHLAELYLPCAIGFYGIGIVLLSRYRITKSQHQENVRFLSDEEAELAAAVATSTPAP